jgi:hypothetical protein
MSPNLELVRSVYADWERGDFDTARYHGDRMQVGSNSGKLVVDGPLV